MKPARTSRQKSWLENGSDSRLSAVMTKTGCKDWIALIGVHSLRWRPDLLPSEVDLALSRSISTEPIRLEESWHLKITCRGRMKILKTNVTLHEHGKGGYLVEFFVRMENMSRLICDPGTLKVVTSRELS